MSLDDEFLWDDFGDAVVGELSLDEVDKLAGCHCVQLDPSVPQESDFVFARTMTAKRGCTLFPVARNFHRLRLKTHYQDVVEPEADVDRSRRYSGGWFCRACRRC